MGQLGKTFIFSVLISMLSVSIGAAQGKFIEKTNHYGDVIETNDPNADYGGVIDGFYVTPVKWTPYETRCKSCRKLASQYNETMQDLFNAQAMISKLEGEKRAAGNLNSRPDPTGSGQTDEEAARALDMVMTRNDLFNVLLPQLKENVEQLRLTAKNLRNALSQCEFDKCAPKKERDEPLVSLPGGEIILDPVLFIDWKGPYYEVCEDCRKLANKLNGFYDIALKNVNIVNSLESRIPYLNAQLRIHRDYYGDIELDRINRQLEKLESGEKKSLSLSEAERNKRALKYHREQIKKLADALKDAEKGLEKALKEREKITKDFNETLAKFNECIEKKCPPQKQACVFPDQLFESMTIGPNDEVGSSAQAAKEMRDRVTGAAKGAATKAIGNLLGFGGFGGGGSKGPKTDKDRTRGDFTRLSSGDTDLDVRASWRDDQLIVSTEIDNSPDDGTFHAQWLQDKEGNIYLPTRYLIFKMYRDWKLTVSWTEDHYVNGEHVFHDEGQEITTGRDLLGTWSLFEGENAKTNSIWGMLGFDTAAKGVRHIGAVYDIPMSAFPDDCQMQLVTHISEPSKPTVGTLPIVGNLFKHVDESRKKPETIVLIQPHIIENADE